ncbi:MAG: hypothetical protein A3H97_18530 [Acidobacteria bacterium RIFCSPLOWO2_02_FULL_65_29]|nr:MAG: hypothetical protein A3H97_18530 [Acidobacteria bacterium RIFCSPLOWO2_02_FULL_65_29]
MRLAAVLLLLAWGTAVVAQEASSVRLTETDGSVVVRKSGAKAWRAAREGDILERGDRVAAKARSAALLLWSNGSMVKLYPDSEIALTGVTLDLANRMETTLLELERGRLFVKAQVPDHLFTDFKIRMGSLEVRTQGAEFAIAPDAQRKSFTAWVLSGRVTSDLTPWARGRIEEGRQGTIATAAKPDLADLNKPMDDRIWQALAKVSRDLGGSLRTDEITAGPGGKLVARIGGVRSRRGNTPYKVSFKALTAGGSGRIKSILWEFGDGESATGREAEHTFTLGLYTVVLRVEDADGQKASAQVGILAQRDCGC